MRHLREEKGSLRSLARESTEYSMLHTEFRPAVQALSDQNSRALSKMSPLGQHWNTLSNQHNFTFSLSNTGKSFLVN